MCIEKNNKDGLINLVPVDKASKTFLQDMTKDIENLARGFVEQHKVGTSLSGKDRLRLIRSGIRNNGFIDKAFDIARDNPQFMPSNFDVDKLEENNRRLDELRQLMLVLQEFQQIIVDAFMQQSDVCFRDALVIYHSLQEQVRAKKPGALPFYETLGTYFRRRRRFDAETETEDLENVE